jgi:hypothetical protein
VYHEALEGGVICRQRFQLLNEAGEGIFPFTGFILASRELRRRNANFCEFTD